MFHEILCVSFQITLVTKFSHTRADKHFQKTIKSCSGVATERAAGLGGNDSSHPNLCKSTKKPEIENFYKKICFFYLGSRKKKKKFYMMFNKFTPFL